MNFINATAPEGAAVLILGPEKAAREFARPDLNLVAEDASIIILDSGEYVREFSKNNLVIEQPGSDQSAIDYVLTCTSAARGVPHHANLPIIYTVQHGKAILSSVKIVPENLEP